MRNINSKEALTWFLGPSRRKKRKNSRKMRNIHHQNHTKMVSNPSSTSSSSSSSYYRNKPHFPTYLGKKNNPQNSQNITTTLQETIHPPPRTHLFPRQSTIIPKLTERKKKKEGKPAQYRDQMPKLQRIRQFVPGPSSQNTFPDSGTWQITKIRAR